MSAIKLLNRDLQQYIWDQQWPKFRDIQAAAIENIITTQNNFILIARTASGKTEAAFLPAISLINDWSNSVKILYISPLIALINDQFSRIEQLCKYGDISIAKWHGEASVSMKKKLIAQPEGILLITPESIEAMLFNHPEYAAKLFNSLEFIIVDEIHSFLGTDRGKHLQSLLNRLQVFNKSTSRFIGLSATLNRQTYETVKDFYNNGQETKIILDKSRNDIRQYVDYVEHGEGANGEPKTALPASLLDALYNKTRSSKSLIFPNTRGRVEEIAVGLRKRAEHHSAAHHNYYAHHSSVDRELREFIEDFAKSSGSQSFAISCTSTLELGIDIGSIDTVVQVDSTFSVASLVQRLGRSGRQTGQSNLFLYATDKWELLQSIACIELYKAGFVEPVESADCAYNVLLHQMLSAVGQYRGVNKGELVQALTGNPIARAISDEEKLVIVQHLIKQDILEDVGGELVIGLAGEKITTGKNFYSLFETKTDFKVMHKDRRIGELPWSPSIAEDQNIFLAAKIWKILNIDTKLRKIFVAPAPDGKRPTFGGNAGSIHQEVCNMMLRIIRSDDKYNYLSEGSWTALQGLREELEELGESPPSMYRPVLQGLGNSHSKQRWYTFAGTKVFETIFLLLKYNHGLNVSKDGKSTAIVREVSGHTGSLKDSSLPEVISLLSENGVKEDEFKHLLKELLESTNSSVQENKFAKLLPIDMRVKQIMSNNFDIPATNLFLKNLVL